LPMRKSAESKIAPESSTSIINSGEWEILGSGGTGAGLPFQFPVTLHCRIT